jgi:hypothetical protein
MSQRDEGERMETVTGTPATEQRPPQPGTRSRITGPRREPSAAERHAEIESELGHRFALVAD